MEYLLACLIYVSNHFRGTAQKLNVMAPVLLTGLIKIIDQPDEVRQSD